MAWLAFNSDCVALCAAPREPKLICVKPNGADELTSLRSHLFSAITRSPPRRPRPGPPSARRPCSTSTGSEGTVPVTLIAMPMAVTFSARASLKTLGVFRGEQRQQALHRVDGNFALRICGDR